MKIVNTDRGEAYQLKPDTQLTIERTNPFFNDYAEQTVPCALPASPHNMRLLRLEATHGSREKQQVTNVTIQDGEYFARCTQAVLSVKRHADISTSFYMNDGSLYSRIGETKLKDIWTGEHERFTYGYGTVDDMIAWCRLLASGDTLDSGNYRIFPVLLYNDAGVGTPDFLFDYKVLNNWTWSSSYIPHYNGGSRDFYNAVDRQEYVNGRQISVPKGYYISPFIRVEYVLQRLFGYFGYTLQTDFFSQEPFKSMVLLNSVIDSIINGYVLNADLVPDISCKEMLTLIRSKFCCEFVCDEHQRTVSIAFFKDVAQSAPVADLTGCMTEEPTFAFLAQKQYRRVVIKPKYSDDSDDSETYDTLEDLLHDSPIAEYNEALGQFYKTGYHDSAKRKIGIGNVKGYDAGGAEEEQEIEIPDHTPPMRRFVAHFTNGDCFYLYYPYIGKSRTLHSKISLSTDGSDAEQEEVTMPPMLCFSLHSPLGSAGTTTSYTFFDTFPTTEQARRQGFYMVDDQTYQVIPDVPSTRHLWDYSLQYWGDDGIFNRFYRDMDLYLRNALEETKVKLLLSQHQKADMPATAVYTIRSERYMLNKMKFTLGTKGGPQESTLLTMAIKEPVSESGTLDNLLPINSSAYKWQEYWQQMSRTPSSDEIQPPTVVYPPAPSAEYVGQHYGYRIRKTRNSVRDEYEYYEFWLECVPK